MVARVARTHVSSGYPGSIPGPGVQLKVNK